jgi:hypothetical protein
MKIRFSGFWTGFTPNNFFITKLLKNNNIPFEIVGGGEDIHILSCMSTPIFTNSAKHNIFYTGESTMTHPRASLNVGFQRGEKCLQIRNYERIHYEQTGNYKVYSTLDKVDYKSDKKFCIFAVNNGGCKVRNDFFDFLNTYKRIDSIGRFRNNCNIKGQRSNVEAYKTLLNKYNFMITFENKPREWYMTEKIYNAMLAGVIPIYWGDSNSAHEVFNKDSFINVPSPQHFNDAFRLVKLVIENEGDKYVGQKYVLNPEELDSKFQHASEELLNIITK